jgi:putative hydrolase of the HAD superfamily
MKKPIALVFDLGNVLLPIDLDKTYEAFASFSNQFNAEEIKHVTLEEGLWVKYESGLQSDKEFETFIVERFNLTCTSEQFQQAFNALLLRFSKDSCEYIKQLGLKFPTYLLSNTSRIHSKEFLDSSFPNFELFDSFKQIHLSYEMGFVKPDPRIYLQVIDENQLHGHHVVFFDDNVNNIEAAKKIGWDAILINPVTSIQQIQHHIQSVC